MNNKIVAALAAGFTLLAQLAPAQEQDENANLDNLADKGPVKDPTYASYPYYDNSWFDTVGRTVYFTVNYQFGGP